MSGDWAVRRLHERAPHASLYMDAGHGGWLGWPSTALCGQRVARLDGRLWVLELPSGESDRAALERRVFERAYLGKPRYTRSGDWWAWERAFQGQGLGKLWKSLLVEADRAERYRRELKASSHNGRSVTA